MTPKQIKAREDKVVRWRDAWKYGKEPMSFKDIGSKLNISKQMAHAIYWRAVNREQSKEDN